MKIRNRVLSFILVISLLFSSFVFTTGAAENDLGIDEDVELYSPSALYDKLTTENSATKWSKITASGNSASFGLAAIYGGKNIDAYHVTGIEQNEDGEYVNANEYIMLVPSDTAANVGHVGTNSQTDHVQINVNVSKGGLVYTGGTSDVRYVVIETDVATESNVLPLYYEFISRHHQKDSNGNYNGSYDYAGGTVWKPVQENNSLYVQMTPGVFHHLTFIADAYTNTLYVYFDNELIETVADGVIAASWHDEYLAGDKTRLEGLRIQMNSGVALNGEMSICFDNMKGYTLTNDDSANGSLSAVVGNSLSTWSYSGYTKYNADTANVLPSLLSVNGTTYNNLQGIDEILDTYRLGNTAEIKRDVYSGSITVNCDATVETGSSNVALNQGVDVTLTQKSASTWIATLNHVKYSAEIQSTNVADITNALIYPHKDNLISGINQTHAINATTDALSDAAWAQATDEQKAIIEDDRLITKDEIDALTEEQRAYFTDYSINGLIVKTDDNDEYLIIRDSTKNAGDFAPIVHYQVNANTPLKLNTDRTSITNAADYKLGEHKYIVFDQDIYTESSFINVYNGFNLRSSSNDALSATAVYAESLEVTAGKWHHITYIGEISTGHSYLFIDGDFVGKVEQGLYDEAALEKCSDYKEMVLGSFRTMQVAGENKTGQNLTPDMSAAADNFCLRWADDDGIVAFITALNSDSTLKLSEWSGSIHNTEHSEEIPVIATVDGVDYYDTVSLTNALTADYSDTKVRNVVFYRDFVGTVSIDSRAIVNTTCVGETSDLVYAEGCTVTPDADNEKIITVDWPIVSSVVGTADNIFKNIHFGYNTTTNTTNSSNLYSSHTLGASNGTSYVVTDNGHSYLLDPASSANTHTLNIGVAMTPDVTHSAQISSSAWATPHKVTFYSTKTHHYFSTELDVSKNSNILSGTKLIYTLNGASKNFTVDLSSMLSGYNKGEFVHVTVIGEIDVSTEINYNLTRSSSLGGGYISAASATNSSYTYKVTYKVYVNDTLAEASETDTITGTSASTFTWSNVQLVIPAEDSLLVDNVFATTAVVESDYVTSYTHDSRSLSNSNLTTIKNDFTDNHGSSDTLGDADPTITDAKNAAKAFASSDLSGNTNYGSGTNTSSAYEDSYVATEVIEKRLAFLAENTVAYIGEKPYTTWAELTTAINGNVASDSNHAVTTVTLVKKPESALNITANTLIHTGGNLKSTDNLITAGSGCVLRADDENGTVKVIVLGYTDVLASFNGVDYTDEETLRDVLSIAESATLDFYKLPAAPIEMTCPAVIETNGLTATSIYSYEEYVLYVTVNGTKHTLSTDSRTGTVTVNLADGTSQVYTLPYGTDIADYLLGEGLLVDAFVSGGYVYSNITWSSTPEGKVNAASYTFTATAGKKTALSSSVPYVYVDASGTEHALTTAADAISKLTSSGNGTLVLNSDLLLETMGNSVKGNGTKSIYLNGHTISTNVQGEHGFVPNGDTNLTFYGPGTLDFTESITTKALVFCNYAYTGTVTFDGLTINTTYFLAQLRDGHLVIKDCDVTSYLNQGQKNVGLIALAEDYTSGGYDHSTAPLSLTITGSTIRHRYQDVVSKYPEFTSDIPLINHKVVKGTKTNEDGTTSRAWTETGSTEVKVFIDNSTIISQGSLINATASQENYADAYLYSNLKVYIDESTIRAKSFYKDKIKPESIIIYDDVKTNIDDVTGISFAINLLKAKCSEGLNDVLYTSHDYATVVWDNGGTGTKEFWASGSTPTNDAYKFHNTEQVEAGMSYTFTSTTTSFPFKLFSNLTLGDNIGFNIYIPSSQSVAAVYIDGNHRDPNKYPGDEETIRETYVGLYGGYCYDYTYYLAPQEASRNLTLVIQLTDGKQVSRIISVGQYLENVFNTYVKDKSDTFATQTKALLSVTLGYLEQATMYAGNRLDMSKISKLRGSGYTGITAADFTGETDYSASFFTAFDGVIRGIQVNVSSSPAIRFNLVDGVTVTSATVTTIVDNIGTTATKDVTIGDGYIEVPLRCYELGEDFELTIDGTTATYSLYSYYCKLQSLAGTSTGRQYEYTAALKLIEAMHSYGRVASEYLEANKSETDPNA